MVLYTMLTRQLAEHGAVKPQNGMSFPHSVSPSPSVHCPKNNEFVQSHFQDFFLGDKKKSYLPSPVFCMCLKNFRTNCTDSHLPGLNGASLFWTSSFFLSVCKRCFIRIHLQNSYDFRSLIFLWLVILYLLWQSVVIVTACH